MTHGTIKAILLSGPPGCGETTVIRRLVELSCPSWTGSTATGWPPRPLRPPEGRRAAAGARGMKAVRCVLGAPLGGALGLLARATAPEHGRGAA